MSDCSKIARGCCRAWCLERRLPGNLYGIYGYPLLEAAPVAVESVRASGTGLDEVRFVLFDDAAYRAARRISLTGETLGRLSPFGVSS